jgi:hypothetical protein
MDHNVFWPDCCRKHHNHDIHDRWLQSGLDKAPGGTYARNLSHELTNLGQMCRLYTATFQLDDARSIASGNRV